MEILTEKEDKITHLNALATIAICDNKLDDTEKLHLISLQKMYGVPEDSFKIEDIYAYPIQDLSELLQRINQKDTRAKLSFIQDLISCAYSDGIYSDVERKKLRDISSILSISDSKVNEIENLNIELINTYKKLALALDFN